MIDGVLYTTGGTRRSVVALDGKDGELMWAHSLREGRRAGIAPRQLSGRGVSYWTDGRGDDRVLYVTTGYQLVELNAKNGAMVSSFGKNGVVDLKLGAVKGKGEQIDLETGEIGIHSTPILFRDRLYLQLIHDGAAVVVALEAGTGREVWKAERKSDGVAENKHSYASPCLWRRGAEARLGPYLGEELVTRTQAEFMPVGRWLKATRGCGFFLTRSSSAISSKPAPRSNTCWIKAG